MAISIPYINPVAIELGPLAIRWYSIAYIVGIIAGIAYLKFLAKKSKFTLSTCFFDDLFIGSVIGIVLGGRLGFITFYQPLYYFAHPLDIIKIWHGGMSFHGGIIGFTIAIMIIAKKHNLSSWKLLDLCACVAPIGIFLGRIANFINTELLGRVTNVSWGVIFPDGTNLIRHPSQLYEALSEGLLLFIILNCLFFYKKLYQRPRLLSASFGIWYATTRITSEFFREPDISVGYFFEYFTLGQILSSIILVMCLYLFMISKNDLKSSF